MSVLVITAPAQIVSLDRAKAHLAVDDADQDALISSLVAAATAHIDGPSGWLGRALGLQTLELRLEGFDHARHERLQARGRHWPAIDLPFAPIVEVDSVNYLDALGVDQLLDPSAYVLGSHGLAPTFGTSWPTARWQDDSIRIRYQAGWPGTGDEWTGPEPIRVAILMMVGDLFENRETQAIAATKAALITNSTAELLLSPWKVWA